MIVKCRDKRCKTCPAVLNARYDVNIDNNTVPICKTAGVIYMLRCGCCNIKYIGQTSLALNLRINNHRMLCNSKNYSGGDYVQSKYEHDHFSIHCFSKIIIDILDVVPDHNKRLELENRYITLYKTAYPYGLNDRVNNISVTSIKDSVCIYDVIFNNVEPINPRTNRVRSRNKNKGNRYIDFNVFLEDINDNCLSKTEFIKYVKGKILGLKRTKTKVLVRYVSKFNFKLSHVKDLVIDLIKYKLKCNVLDVSNNKFDSYLVIDFSHKYIDLLDIPQLLHDPSLVKSFPVKETYPKLSFRYSQTIGAVAFNYSQFSKNVNVEDINNYPCSCEFSDFRDVVHNHVVTGNLDIIEDESIRNIFKYGSKFRLIPTLDINKILENINNSLNEYIYRLCFKVNVHFGHFSEWKIKVLNTIRKKIAVTPNMYPSTISFRKFQNKVKEIQNKYVIMPVDKAGSNFAFVCKRFYAEVLIAEIDSNNTFELTNFNHADVNTNFNNILKKYKVIPSCNNIPFMYATPKFHKNPVKFRFITSAVKCVSKELSIILNLLLDELYSRIERNSEFGWVIKNNRKVLESLEHCNQNPVGPGNYMMATFDFSTLYTALPHDDLIHRIVSLANEYFDYEIYIQYNYKNIIISKTQFVDILKFCIHNNYVQFNNRIYRQKVGIPMGANYSPNLANLYLHFYEAQFLKKNPLGGQLRYSHSFRFIDDLLSVNNRDILYDIRSIYPRILEVSGTNVDPYKKCSFLDMEINIVNGKFISKIYDKRRDFNFDILGLPAFGSNVPSKLAYGVLCAQFCRFALVCSLREDFIFNCQLFVNKLLHNGFPPYIIRKYIYKFHQNKIRTVAKFNFQNNLVNYIHCL